MRAGAGRQRPVRRRARPRMPGWAHGVCRRVMHTQERVCTFVPACEHGRVAIININNDNNEARPRARPGRPCCQPRSALPPRSWGKPPRLGYPRQGRAGLACGPCGSSSPSKGSAGSEQWRLSKQRRLGTPPPSKSCREGRGRRAFPPRRPGFSAPGEADYRKAWFPPAFFLWCRWPQRLGL